MKLVIIESPYSGDTEANLAYARECSLDCIARGESPIAFHLLHTQYLDDTLPDERECGFALAQQWYGWADTVVVYTDHGISTGMCVGINFAESMDLGVEYRSLRNADTPNS